MRSVVLAAALVLVGCTSPEPAGTPPVRHLHPGHLPELGAHGDAVPLETEATTADDEEPAAVAVELIRNGLTEQGLEIIDLGHDIVEATADSALVRVAVTHRGVGARPHTSVYELHLVRIDGRDWELVEAWQVQ